MKLLYGIVLILGLVDWSVQADNACLVTGKTSDGNPLEDDKWQDMGGNCTKEITDQIHRELTASLTYLAMGAHFLSDVQFRPGTSAFFLQSAGEERAHAKDLIDYLLMRGRSVGPDAIPAIIPPTLRWDSIEKAFNDALKIEKSVRENFVNIIAVCESKDLKNDYHAADLMTGKFLEEQHESIRKIVGHLATLNKMNKMHGVFSEIMFDQTLLA